MHAPLHGVQNRLGCEAQTSGATHRHDERPAEFGQVVLVPSLQLGGLCWRALPQASHLLFLLGFGGQVRVGLGSQQGVGFDQGQLGGRVGLHHAVRQGPFQMRQAAKWPLRQGLFTDPRRVFVNAVQPSQGV